MTTYPPKASHSRYQLALLLAATMILNACATPVARPPVENSSERLSYNDDDESNWCRIKDIWAFKKKEDATTYANLLKTKVDDIVQQDELVFVGAPESTGRVDTDSHDCSFSRSLGFLPPANGECLDPREELFNHPLEMTEPESSSGASALAIAGGSFPGNEMLWEKIEFYPSLIPASSTARVRQVAVADSGVYAHDEFKRSSGTLVEWYDTAPSNPSTSCEGGACCKVATIPVGAHGTLVAGLIAAKDDGLGMTGIGKVGKLLSIGVPELKGGCSSRKRLVAAIQCATRLGADIVNVSLQSRKNMARPDDLYEAIEKSSAPSAGQRGTKGHPLFVVAAGNKGCDLGVCKVWPGAINMDWVISVEALDWSLERMVDSNWGWGVDLAVPAPLLNNRLCSTNASSYGTCAASYSEFAMTSAAAAVVTGAATQVWSHPNFENCSAEQIRRILRRHGKVVGTGKPSSCLLQMDFLKTTRTAGGKPVDVCATLDVKDACDSPP